MGVTRGPSIIAVNTEYSPVTNMRPLYIFFWLATLNIKLGSCIQCVLSGVSNKICPAEVTTCAIRQNADTNIGLQTFCEKGTVGCSVQSLGVTCYCNSNNCNKDLASAGLNPENDDLVAYLPGTAVPLSV